ncbi:MAG: hypothetical protein Kow0060_21920 [Methylohalobius crimeensis]
MTRVWTLWIVVGINVLLLFFAFNPWLDTWSGQAVAVLVIEALVLVVIGLPVIIYQMAIRKKSFRQSVRDAIEAVMDFVTGAA